MRRSCRSCQLRLNSSNITRPSIYIYGLPSNSCWISVVHHHPLYAPWIKWPFIYSKIYQLRLRSRPFQVLYYDSHPPHTALPSHQFTSNEFSSLAEKTKIYWQSQQYRTQLLCWIDLLPVARGMGTAAARLQAPQRVSQPSRSQSRFGWP